jgi:hypothetical protein
MKTLRATDPASPVVNIEGKWNEKGDFIPADGSAILYHDPNPTPEFEPSNPWGWSDAEISAKPMQAILEHAYGNCPCENSDECLRNIAAIGEKVEQR